MSFTFPLQYPYGQEVLTLTEDELRQEGFFNLPTDLARELLLWDIADKKQACEQSEEYAA